MKEGTSEDGLLVKCSGSNIVSFPTEFLSPMQLSTLELLCGTFASDGFLHSKLVAEETGPLSLAASSELFFLTFKVPF